MKGCIVLKMVKIKTVIKIILFVCIVGGLSYFIFTGEDSSKVGNIPAAPGLPTPETEDDSTNDEGAEEGAEEGVDQPAETLPEQVAVDDDSPENRVKIITDKQKEIDGHSFLIENDFYELYLKKENLSFIIRDKHTGAVMYSTIEKPVKSNEEWTNFMQSSFVMEYLVGTNIVVYRADMYSGNPDIDLDITSDGFEAKISYAELEISYEVKVTLTDQGIQVEVPQDKIEEKSDKFKIAGLYIYPFLGYSKLGERDGYMFIPDGSGGLIHLEDNNGKYKQPYSEMVYGEDAGIDDPYVLSLFNDMDPFNNPEKILAPVFGMVQTDSEIGYLGIVEEGKFNAKIEAYPNGAILPYNWITSKFIYRQFYNQPTSQDSGTMVVRQKNRNNFDIKVRYDFVSQDKANYMGLAATYRDYLLDEKLITKKEDDFHIRVDLLGTDLEKSLLFKKNVPMTTFTQASDIYEKLQKNGVENILSVYKGWQDKGYYGGLPIRSFQPESELNVGLSLLELTDKAEKNGIDLFLYHDALRINLEELGNTRYKVMKKFNKRTYEENVYGNVYRSFHYLHPDSSATIMKKMAREYEDQAIENIMLSGISNELFSYSEGSKEFDRVTTKDYFESIVSDYSNQFHLVLEQPFSYLWDYSNAILDLPTKSSDYVFTDEDIPFIALTLKGIIPMYAEYTNFQANQQEFFLQLVEQGLYPSFYITHEDPSKLLYTNSSHIYSSKFERYEEMIKDYYEEFEKIHKQTRDAKIQGYERDNGITKVSYDNGVIIYINYEEQTKTFDDQTIDGLSYKVVHRQ